MQRRARLVSGEPVGDAGCERLVAVGRNHLDRMDLFFLHGGTDIPLSRKLTSICSHRKSTSCTSRWRPHGSSFEAHPATAGTRAWAAR